VAGLEFVSYIYMDSYLIQRGMSPVTLSASQLIASVWAAPWS
jgi:hypothetical protein